MACGGACVHTKADPNHCGFCGNVCGTQCIDGQCTGAGPAPFTCPAGQTLCGNACVDLTKDPANCGACGVVCTGDYEHCAAPGVCSHVSDEYCQSVGQTNCYYYCADLRHSPMACGACNRYCRSGDYCRDGLCYIVGSKKGTPPLVDPAIPAGPQALAPTDPTVDGALAASPDSQALAPADVAPCPPGQVDCGGGCVDTESDPLNCGECGFTCGADPCVGGVCIPPADDAPPAPSCPEGQVVCGGGACTDLLTDPVNCGACGVTCGADPCVGGMCTPAQPEVLDCAARGLTDCGGGCVDLAHDTRNCGRCGIGCAAGETCQAGACAAARPAPPGCAEADVYGNCVCVSRDQDGRCIPPDSDPGPTANEPALVTCADQGLTDCGGVCIDTATDPANCGGCGVVCSPGILCDVGVCGAAPAPPAAEPVVAEEPAACLAAGGACDPATPGLCCSGVCTGDGACA
jgi:hypothetical protein